MNTRFSAVGLAMIALAILSGCSAILRIGPGMQNTITEEEAVQWVDDYARQTIEIFSQNTWLEPQSRDVIHCGDPSDNGPLGRVTASSSYWVHGLPESDMPQLFDSFANWLTQRDFVIIADERPKYYFLSGENRQDGFRLAFRYYRGVTPSISASSPCVWPHGTPEPESP